MFSTRLSSEAFARAVEAAMADIPSALVPYMQDITIDVEPMPDDATCAAAGVRDRRTLLGLYQGTPLTLRGVDDSLRRPDRITIYQRNIERMCRSRADVIRQIRKTVFHEVGHHFGLDEDDLADLGYQ